MRPHHGIYHLLGPFWLLFGVALMRANHAAGMILPNVPCEAQHACANAQLAERVKWLGDDVTVDLVCGQSGRHVRRRQDLQRALVRAGRAPLGLDDRRDAGLPRSVLQDDVMHRVPVGNGNTPAAELGEGPDSGVSADDEARSVGVSPCKNLDRKLVVVAHPHRNGLQQMDEIELTSGEAFDERGPASDRARWFDLEAGVLEVSLGVSYE